MRVRFTATGVHLPPEIETAAQLSPRIGKSERWILQRTGVAERRVAREPIEAIAAHAARDALGDGPPPDLVINGSTTPRQLIPDSSVFISRSLGLDGVPSFTVHATCLSFLLGVRTASALIATDTYRRILVVSAELGTMARNPAEPESAALLGDGAGAAILEPTPDGEGSEILAWKMGTWPDGAHLAELRGGGTQMHPNDPATRPEDNLFHMNGPGVYREARKRVTDVLQAVLSQAGITAADVDVVVPHQASGPALAVVPSYGFAADRVVNVVGRIGNCIGASIPMALAMADAEGRLHRGDTVLLVGTGAGLSVAAMLLRW